MFKSSVICTSKESIAPCNGEVDFLEEAWPYLGLLGGEERLSCESLWEGLFTGSLYSLGATGYLQCKRRDKMSGDGVSVSSEAAERKCVKKAEQMGLLLQG